MPTKDSYSLLLGLLVCSIAQVQAAETLPAIKDEPSPDEGVLTYGRINAVLRELARHGDGLLRLAFRLDIQKIRLPLPAVRLLVRTEAVDHPVDIGEGGYFVLPIFSDTEVAAACLTTNVPLHQLVIHGSLEPAVSPGQLTMAAVRHIVRAANALREETLPWHLRWLLPPVEGVRVCSAQPTWGLRWRESAQVLDVTLAVVEGERDPYPRKGELDWPCTVLTGDAWWGDAARVVAPPGTKLSLKFKGQ